MVSTENRSGYQIGNHLPEHCYQILVRGNAQFCVLMRYIRHYLLTMKRLKGGRRGRRIFGIFVA